MERLQRECGVAHPGVAIVPVALAARRLRQRRRQRGDSCARRHVREALDRQGRALHRLTPAMIGDPRTVEPRPPEVDRRRDPPLGLVDVGRDAEPGSPAQRAEGTIALVQIVACTQPALFDPDLKIRREAHRLTRSRRVRDVRIVHELPRGGRPPVVERGLADELELHVPLEAAHGAHEHVIGVAVCRRTGVRCDLIRPLRRPHRQRVAHLDPAGRRLPRGDKDVRAGVVGAEGRAIDPEGAEPEAAGLPVEQAPEDARRVEPRRAEPVDRAVRRDERTRMAVGEEGVLGDRGKRRRRRRALRNMLDFLLGRGHFALQGSCQRPKPARSSSAAAGPHDPGAYECTGGGSSSSGCMTRHVSSTPS